MVEHSLSRTGAAPGRLTMTVCTSPSLCDGEVHTVMVKDTMPCEVVVALVWGLPAEPSFLGSAGSPHQRLCGHTGSPHHAL